MILAALTASKNYQKDIPGIVYLGAGDCDKASPIFAYTAKPINLDNIFEARTL